MEHSARWGDTKEEVTNHILLEEISNFRSVLPGMASENWIPLDDGCVSPPMTPWPMPRVRDWCAATAAL